MNRKSTILCLLLLITLPACGGSKLLKEPEPFEPSQPLATVSDQSLYVTLDWVIVRDGPGTWAREADWDEYLMRVRNDSDQPVQVTRLTVTDSLGAVVESRPGRKLLAKSSKDTIRRYEESGIEVRAGSGSKSMGASGNVAATAVTGGAVLAVASGGGTVLGGFGAAGMAAGAAVVLAPVLAVGGAVKGINQSKVNDQIELRQTTLPLDLAAQEEMSLDVFFPIAPSPTQVELVYRNSIGEHRILIDTRTVLEGLHIEAASE